MKKEYETPFAELKRFAPREAFAITSSVNEHPDDNEGELGGF